MSKGTAKKYVEDFGQGFLDGIGGASPPMKRAFGKIKKYYSEGYYRGAAIRDKEFRAAMTEIRERLNCPLTTEINDA